MTRDERVRWSHRQRKHFKGKMGTVKKLAKQEFIVVPRSHTHGGHSQARSGWTCDDTKDKGFGKTGKYTKSTELSKYRVVMPRNRRTYVRPS